MLCNADYKLQDIRSRLNKLNQTNSADPILTKVNTCHTTINTIFTEISGKLHTLSLSSKPSI